MVNQPYWSRHLVVNTLLLCPHKLRLMSFFSPINLHKQPSGLCGKISGHVSSKSLQLIISIDISMYIYMYMYMYVWVLFLYFIVCLVCVRTWHCAWHFVSALLIEWVGAAAISSVCSSLHRSGDIWAWTRRSPSLSLSLSLSLYLHHHGFMQFLSH